MIRISGGTIAPFWFGPGKTNGYPQMSRCAGSPRISVRNVQRKIAVNIVELESFAAHALQHCLQLQKQKRTDLRNLHEVFIWLISDRRMGLLHRKFLGQSGPTDV